MAAEVGSAYVSIIPSLKGFSARIRAELKSALASVDDTLELKAELRASQVAGEVRRAADAAEKSAEIDYGSDVDTNEVVRSARTAAKVATAAAPSIKFKTELDNSSLFKTAALLSISKAVGAALSGLSSTALITTAVLGLAGAAVQLTAALGPLVGLLLQASSIVAAVPAAIGGAVLAFATLKIGLSGVGEAFKQLASGDVEKFNAALGKLAPSAREFVLAIKDLQPAFSGLRLNVQQALFANLAETVRGLASTLLPALESAFVRIASALNTNVLSSLRSFDGLPAILDNLTGSVVKLSSSLAPLVSALVAVVSVGAQFLNQFAGPAANAVSNFADRVKELAANGTLFRWMQEGVNAFKVFIEAGKDIFGILSGLQKAAAAVGATPLGGLLGSLNQVINSKEGFSALKSVFSDLSKFFDVLVSVLKTALPGVAAIIKIITNLVAAGGPGLNVFLANLVLGLQNLLPAAKPVGDALGAILAAFGPFLPVIGQLISAALIPLAKVLKQLGVQDAPIIAKVLEKLAPRIPEIADAFSDLVVALIPLLAALGELALEVLPVLVPLMTQGLINALRTSAVMFKIISVVLTPVIKLMTLWLQTLKSLSGVVGIFPIIGQFFARIGSTIASAALAVVDFFKTLPGKIGAALLALPGILGNAFLTALSKLPFIIGFAIGAILALFLGIPVLIATALFQLGPVLISVFTSAFEFLKNAVVLGISAVISFFAALPGNILNAIIALPGILSNLASQAFNFMLSAFTTGASAIISFAVQIPGRVLSAVSALPGFLRNVAVDAFNNFRNAIVNGANAAIDFVRGIAGRIRDAIGNLSHILFNAGKEVMAGLKDGIVEGFKKVADTLKGITSKIPDLKGPASKDAKLLFGAGTLIMSGLQQGILSEFDNLKKTLGTVTNAIQVSPSAGVFPANPVPAVSTAGVGGGTFRLVDGVGRTLALLVRDGERDLGRR